MGIDRSVAGLAARFSAIMRMSGNILGWDPTILQVLGVRAAGLFAGCVRAFMSYNGVFVNCTAGEQMRRSARAEVL
jgi:hypothetical protein